MKSQYDVVDIDLEDVLVFAATHCRGLYDRVASENISYEEGIK